MQPATLPAAMSVQEENELRKTKNADELGELTAAIDRLASGKPGTKAWAYAVMAAEDAVGGLHQLEDRQLWPGTFPTKDVLEQGEASLPRVTIKEEQQRLVNNLAMLRARLETTQPDTDERRQAIKDAYEVVEELEALGEAVRDGSVDSDNEDLPPEEYQHLMKRLATVTARLAASEWDTIDIQGEAFEKVKSAVEDLEGIETTLRDVDAEELDFH